jgi:hypothetical protein
MAFHSSGLSLREPPRCSLPGASPMRCRDGRMTASLCSIMTPQLCMPSCQLRPSIGNRRLLDPS